MLNPLSPHANDLLAEFATQTQPGSLPEELVGDLEVRLATLLIQKGALERAEELLRAAATRRLDASGQRALAVQKGRLAGSVAQRLQREQKPTEAIAQWREAIRVGAHETSSYLSLARAYEQAGQPGPALTTYLELVEALPTLANSLVAAERIDLLAPNLPAVGVNQSVRVAMLGNATLDQLQSYLKVECYRAGLRPAVYQAPFDQYTQEILDPNSGLYAFAPDIVVCAVHASRLFPRLHHSPLDLPVAERRAEMDAGLATLQQLLDVLTERSSALVLVHNFVVPQYPALGILDVRDELGQTAAFTEINNRFAELARTRYRGVYVVDEERVQAHAGKATATDPRLWLSARMPWSEPVLAGLSREYLRFVRAARGLGRKCIVVDLDNTLWGGVIGEDGLAGIKLGAEPPGNAFLAFQRELERLWRRGILLAICSKNNPSDALPVFEQHPEMLLKLSHFAAQRINWQPKAANIREIAHELNIGLDSLVFLDDNPVERAAVRAELPQVLTPELPGDPAEYRRALLELSGVFDTLALTDEDRHRNQLYAEQQARQAAQVQLGQSDALDEYLTNLEIVVEIELASEVTLPRIAQLTGKTNQFNLTTRRYTETEIADRQSHGWRVYGARVRDRFGDNGLTGVAMMAPEGGGVWQIDTFLLSCRVMGRGVESALFAFLAAEARAAGARLLQGWYVPTDKNVVVGDCYERHGFRLMQSNDEGTLWQLDLTEQSVVVPDWLTVRTPGLAPLSS